MAKKKMKQNPPKRVESTTIKVRTGADTYEDVEVKNTGDSKSVYLGNARFVNALTKQNMLVYFLVAILPPVGLYFLWMRENTIPYSAKILWTGIAFLIMYQYVLMLTGNATVPMS